MEDYLKTTYKNIIYIDTESAQKSKNVVTNFMNYFLTRVQNEERALVEMNPELVYLGSFPEGLKICTPNEYDVDVVLTLPFPPDKIELDATNCDSDFTELYLSDNKTKHLIVSWSKGNGRICATKFREWVFAMSKVVIDSTKSITVDDQTYTLSFQDTGVAVTVAITDQIGFSIFVDVVFVFRFRLPKMPKNMKLVVSKVEQTQILDYHLVPINKSDWRMSFPSQEFFLLNNSDFREAMKLLKYIFHVHRIQLPSYALKTLFLWSTDINSSVNITRRLIEIIQLFKSYLISGVLPSYWFPDDNLILNIPKIVLGEWCAQVTQILQCLQSDCVNDFSLLISVATEPIRKIALPFEQ